MSDANETTETTTPVKGFGKLRCPKCEADGFVSMYLTTTNDTVCFHCNECENDFEEAEVAEMVATMANVVAKWTKVLAWAAAMPRCQDE